MGGLRAIKRAVIVLAVVVGGSVAGAPSAVPVTAPTAPATHKCDQAPAATAGRAGPREPSAWKNPPIEQAPDGGHPGFKATIPVYFHIFTNGTEGRLSVSDLKQQITVLNMDFDGREGGFATGFSFTYGGVDYTDNATWFNALDPGTSVERSDKAATHVARESAGRAAVIESPQHDLRRMRSVPLM